MFHRIIILKNIFLGYHIFLFIFLSFSTLNLLKNIKYREASTFDFVIFRISGIKVQTSHVMFQNILRRIISCLKFKSKKEKIFRNLKKLIRKMYSLTRD